MDITRRKGLQAAAVAVAAASMNAMPAKSSELGGPRRAPTSGKGLKFATMNGFKPDHKSRVSRQIG